MREHSGRLICDACTGMFLTREDLVMAIEDLSGMQPELHFYKDEAAKARKCPRCELGMIEFRLKIEFAVIEKEKKTWPRLDRCDHHGVWFDRDELAEVFEVVSKVSGRGGGGVGMAAGPLPGNGRGWGFGR
jgi:Zn-finger nucleic acid-binding protein